METKTITEQLREIVRESPVTQAELSRAIGCSKPVISRFLSGHSISTEMLDKIGTFFHVQLQAREDDMPIGDLQKPIGRPSRARKLAELITSLTPEQKDDLTPERLMSIYHMTHRDIPSWDLIFAAIAKFKKEGEK